MEYLSTRNQHRLFSFSQVVLEGLAPDGGLFVPKSIPNFSSNLDELARLNYQELAAELFVPFCAPCLSKSQLQTIVQSAYSSFPSTPLRLVHLSNHSILELFYGPTLSFKDYALQLLAEFFEQLLPRGQQLNLLAATSGDTGSAAIAAVAGKKNLAIFTLFPDGKVSPIQKLQMTSAEAANVYNLAVAGNFDDCQKIIKQIFADLNFKNKFQLGAVNSINWARILGQIPHYFYAGLRHKKAFPKEPLKFCIPTGNFGHIYAGFIARQMGLPIEQLILATNENNILTRVVQSGEYKIQQAVTTLAPAMDIQRASNFERYLYHLYGGNTKQITSLMLDLQNTNFFMLPDTKRQRIKQDFLSETASKQEVIHTIKKYYKTENYLMDPHTAVGVSAATKLSKERTICLSTAHYAKFYETIEKIINSKVELPPSIKKLFVKTQRFDRVAASSEQVTRFMLNKLS